MEKMIYLLRCLFFIQTQFSIEVKEMHVPGKYNGLADTISCNNLSVLSSQIPEAAANQEVIPEKLVKLLMKERLD